LEELRRTLTLYYVNHGYPNSGVVIPDQAVTDGIITFQVIEGVVTEIQVEGTNWFRTGYLKDRIALGTGVPFNLTPLRERLQLLLQDQRLERVNAELKPGAKLGEAVLGVTVKETSPWKAWVEFNNYQTPVVGAERGLMTVAHQNVTGNGDTAMLTYGGSHGVHPIIDTSYLIPLTRYDTTFSFGYRRNDFLVVEKAFRPLDINSQSEIFTMTLRQPLYRTLTDEVAVFLTGERLFNKTTLLGQAFNFVPGAQQGAAFVSALRFGQEWTHRTADSVIALRSRFSVGIDVMGATINSGPVADGQFFSWLGQAHWVKRLESTGIEVVNRADVQLANDRLFPLEQFAVGGRFSVRGYRENTLIRDNAFLYSLEPRIPIWTLKDGYELLQLAPFVDVGYGWNAKGVTPDPQLLASAGVGLRANLLHRGFASVYWGHQLNHVAVPGAAGNLQDHGLHVQVTINVL
jgi:hemolysin activation/secretion protein